MGKLDARLAAHNAILLGLEPPRCHDLTSGTHQKRHYGHRQLDEVGSRASALYLLEADALCDSLPQLTPFYRSVNMGYAHIIWVYEDGLRFAPGKETELGHAVAQVCRDESSVALGSHLNCVNSADEVHSSDTRLYLWQGNCLRPLHQLGDEALTIATRVLAETRSNRQASLTPTLSEPAGHAAALDEPVALSGIGCPKCFEFIQWDGDVQSTQCQCGQVLYAAELARRLLAAYSAPSLPDVRIGMLAHDLMRHAAQHAWGDATRIGRRDWLQLGLPLTDTEFASVVSRGGSVQLSSCSRLFQEFDSRATLPETAAAVARRLKTESNVMDREFLYRIAAAPQIVHESLLPSLLEAIQREELGTIARNCCEEAIKQKQAITGSS